MMASAAQACAGAPPDPELRWRFFALNTGIAFFFSRWHVADLCAQAEAVFHRLEVRFSRFLADSELSALNSSAGKPTRVSGEMLRLLEVSRRFHDGTGGVFDPTVLPQLERAGYDRSFELIDAEGPAPGAPALPRYSLADVQVDAARSSATLPPGLRLDFGGIGKGYAVDQAARVLAPTTDYLIDAGGDIYAAGHGPDGDGWLVGVAHPSRDDECATVRLRDQALATSTTARRRWRRAGRWLHHVIDPRTGLPAESDVLSVSVIAPTTVEADVFATTALILGSSDGAAFLEERGAHGFFVRGDDLCVRTDSWPGEE